MTPSEEIPKRSKWWFRQKTGENSPVQLFDSITKVFFISLILFTFIILWPITSQINFETVFFTPLVPFLVKVLALVGLGTNDALKILFIFSFMTSTAGVYLLVRKLTKRQVTPIFAASLYIVPAVTFFVVTYLVAGLDEFIFASAKSFLSVFYGTSDFFLALSLIPYAAIFFLRYLKRNETINLVASVFFCGLIFLASGPQSLSLLLVLAVIATTEFFLGQAREKLKRFFLVLTFAFGLVSFWYLPTIIGDWAQVVKSQAIINLKYLFPLPFTVGILGLLFLFVIFSKREERQGVLVSFLLFLVFFILVFDWLISGHSYVTHPNRLIANLVMFSSMGFALLVAFIFDQFDLSQLLRFEKWSQPAKILGTLIFGLASFSILLGFAFVLTPLAVRLVSGPFGIWNKLRVQLIADQKVALDPNFADGWPLGLGIIISLIFFGVLVFWASKDLLAEEAND